MGTRAGVATWPPAGAWAAGCWAEASAVQSKAQANAHTAAVDGLIGMALRRPKRGISLPSLPGIGDGNRQERHSLELSLISLGASCISKLPSENGHGVVRLVSEV